MNELKIPTFVLLVSLVLLITLALSLNTPRTARATIITVNSTQDVVADDDQCTLREAIISANTDTASGGAIGECAPGVGDDTIDLTGISGTIDLSGPLPDLSSNMVFNGPGAGVLAVRRNSGGNYRIFMVGSGATVTISGLTVRDGLVVGEWGGGILNIGTLTLTHSAVISNSSDSDGGGIYSMHSLTLTDSTVSGNQAGSRGGGIFNYPSYAVELHDSIVGDNHADRGGGVYNAGTLTLSGSTVSGNGAEQGGGIDNEFGSAELISSTLSSNQANAAGGGIFNNPDSQVELVSSTISDNHATDGGAGIYNAGRLMLNGSAVHTNDTNTIVPLNGHGGGIYNAIAGTLTLSNSIVSLNRISNFANDGYGGGIYNAGTLTLTNSSVYGNNTFGDHCHGGGVHNEGRLTVRDSTISGNNASAAGAYGDGGGLHNTGSGSSATLTNSTISSNSSIGGGSGGGLWNSDGASMVLTNSTVTFNSSANNGGGINNTRDGALVLNNSTVGAFNSASARGGGIWNDNGGTLSLKNSIIASNVANLGGLDCYNTATLTSLDHNLLGDSGGCPFTTQTNDQVDVDPLLGPLQNNGGPTETRVPLPGSPAIDAVPLAGCVDHLGGPIVTDQRGYSRPQGAACDIGAVEVSGGVDLSLIKALDRPNPAVGETVVFTVQAFNHGPLAATGVVISDRLPLGLTFDSAHASQGVYAGDTGGWPVGRLNAGVGATLTLSATVDAGAAGLTITNTAAISAADQVDPDPTNNVYTVAFSVPALKVVRNFLPLIVRNYAPPLTFPLHVGPAIPVRPVAYQGELFYTTSLRIPGELPPGGRFYFSSQRDAVAQALVDDELVLLWGGTERFSYLFATAGPPQPAVVELPRAVLETLLGQTVTLEYRDVYGVVIEASEMWLIWVP